MNSFNIVVDSSAKRDLKKLKKTNPKLLFSLVKIIDSLKSNPYQGKSLKGNKKGCYSLRKGNHRIIYEVHPSQKLIHILRVGHRREIYR